MTFNTNILALNAYRGLKAAGAGIANASARLSTGLRINSGADDPAGLAISEKMRAQIRGMEQAARNAQNGISLIQTAEGGIATIQDMVHRMRELAVQAANDTNDDSDRRKIQNEINQLLAEIDLVASRTEFNKKTLLDGSLDGVGGDSLHLQIGANANQNMFVSIPGMSVDAIFGGAPINVETVADAVNAITILDNGLNYVSEARAQLGAYQNRLEYTIRSLEIGIENTSASESRIRDADMAKEMMRLSKYQVLQQAAIWMLSQANQQPQLVLQLLR